MGLGGIIKGVSIAGSIGSMAGLSLSDLGNPQAAINEVISKANSAKDSILNGEVGNAINSVVNEGTSTKDALINLANDKINSMIAETGINDVASAADMGLDLSELQAQGINTSEIETQLSQAGGSINSDANTIMGQFTSLL